MQQFTVKTNWVPREIINGYQLSSEDRKEFDYFDWPAIDRGEDSADFVRYKGELHDLQDFQTWNSAYSPLFLAGKRWDGFKSDTFFSGLLIKYVNHYAEVIVGRYYA